MVIAKILGTLDIIIAILFLITLKTNIILSSILFPLGIYLIVKGLIFTATSGGTNIVSILDIAAAIAIIVATNTSIPLFIGYIVVIFLIQKGIFSML